MTDTQSKTAGSEVAKASILAEAAEIAMGGWHGVEKARAFACSVSDYLLSTQAGALQAVSVGTASMYAQQHRLAVTTEWMIGWNACLDAQAELASANVGTSNDGIHSPFNACMFRDECRARALAATQPNAAPAAEVVAMRELLAYVLQDEQHNRLTPRVIDIAYTAFMLAKQPNTEDGGSSDWFNDTRPAVRKAVEKLRNDFAALAAPAAAIDAREQEGTTAEQLHPAIAHRGHFDHDGNPVGWHFAGGPRDGEPWVIGFMQQGRVFIGGKYHKELTGERCEQMVIGLEKKLQEVGSQLLAAKVEVKAALASRSEAPAARPNAAGQEHVHAWRSEQNQPDVLREVCDCGALRAGINVPTEPTPPMHRAFRNEYGCTHDFSKAYRAMLAAAPPLEAVGSSGMNADQARGEKA